MSIKMKQQGRKQSMNMKMKQQQQQEKAGGKKRKMTMREKMLHKEIQRKRRRRALPIPQSMHKLLWCSPVINAELDLLSMVSEMCIRSEYEFFRLGIRLCIPYDLLLHIMRCTFSTSINLPLWSTKELMKEAGMSLLRLARNAYFDSGDLKHLKYFYYVVLPNYIIVPLQYFYNLSVVNLQSEEEKRLCFWDCTCVDSSFLDEDMEFVLHLFCLILGMVTQDYARYANHRLKLFSPDGNPTQPDHSPNDVEDSPTLVKE